MTETKPTGPVTPKSLKEERLSVVHRMMKWLEPKNVEEADRTMKHRVYEALRKLQEQN